MLIWITKCDLCHNEVKGKIQEPNRPLFCDEHEEVGLRYLEEAAQIAQEEQTVLARRLEKHRVKFLEGLKQEAGGLRVVK